MTNIVGKIVKSLVDILIFACFAVLVVIIGAKAKSMVTKTSYTELFGYSVFNVVTGSMEPTIFQNDIIIDKKADDYKVNDIVTYEQNGEYVTHRIIAVVGDKVVTQGDNNNTPDRDIPKSAIIGKVIKIMPNAGIWQQILTTPAVIVAIFITLLLFDFAFSFKGFNKKETVTDTITELEPVPVIEEKEDIKITVVEETIEMPMLKSEVKKKLEDLDEEYTIRLDLTKIQDEINAELNEEE